MQYSVTIQNRPPNFRDESGHFYLVRCFSCEPERGRENYAFAVAAGICFECEWSESELEQAFCLSLKPDEAGTY